MAHADVALDVERRRPREAERLHVRVDDGLVDAAVHAPRALELGHDLVILGAAVAVDQLDALVGPVVRHAVVHDDVEAVWKQKASGRKSSNLHVIHAHSPGKWQPSAVRITEFQSMQ